MLVNALTSALKTPVVFLVFNRPRTTRIVFNAIAKARPVRLLIVADGPRRGVAGEADRCREVREVVSEVDWPCKVQTNFADENLGCQERVISGLNWAFSQVEEAIILEDDCLPHPSFFLFCQELLGQYRGDSRIAMISGDNFVERYVTSDFSYYYSRMAHIWGWATWRAAWQRYDRHLERWPEIKAGTREIFGTGRIAAHWERIFDSMHKGTGPNTWDYQWAYTLLVNNSLSIVPRVNLVENIGFASDGTHTSVIDPNFLVTSKSMEFPLRHPPAMIPSNLLDGRDQKLWLRASRLSRVLKKFSNYTKRRFG